MPAEKSDAKPENDKAPFDNVLMLRQDYWRQGDPITQDIPMDFDPLSDPQLKKPAQQFERAKAYFAKQGITIHPVMGKIVDIHVGANPLNLPKGITEIISRIEIRDQAGIATFIQKGGRIVSPQALQGYTFSKSRTEDKLTIEQKDQGDASQLAGKLKSLGVDYKTPRPNTFEIEGINNLAAIALSDGKFTGSREFLQELGYSVHRR